MELVPEDQELIYLLIWIILMENICVLFNLKISN